MGENKEIKIALSGNPNVGKSTIFNALTGLNQHTGNWTGKTVSNAKGSYNFDGKDYEIVDVPGTYSLMASSLEEEVARNFICFGESDVTVIVCDATCLERNLNLTLQILETGVKAVIVINLLDEAKKKGIEIDLDELSLQLGAEVVGTSARSGKGLEELKEKIKLLSESGTSINRAKVSYDQKIEDKIEKLTRVLDKREKGNLKSRFLATNLIDSQPSFKSTLKQYLGYDLYEDEEIKEILKDISSDDVRDLLVSGIVKRAEDISRLCVFYKNEKYNEKDRKLDKLFTSKLTGFPIMILMFGLIFWLSIVGANYPSELLSSFFGFVEEKLSSFLLSINVPTWVEGLFIRGIFKTVTWVVAVMLPPMAIFFPLFTILEDFGYLPRVAFNMDRFFRKSNAHGKQALTMCMGFGCNACGVTGCRIIDSPRERKIAILTNNFVPCNGRFPTLISIITMFFVGGLYGGVLGSVLSAFILVLVILAGVFMTLLVSSVLSKTILKGEPSSFALELPPYRRPQILKVIVRSIFDRTLFVLGRAVTVAVPAGAIIWLMANININDMSILYHFSNFLDPFAKLLGLDGVILLAFILGFPANEIVFPIILTAYLSNGSLIEVPSVLALKEILIANGWTIKTAICMLTFVLFHFPCSTTCMTVKKETGSKKDTALAFLIPTLVGIILCVTINAVFSIVI